MVSSRPSQSNTGRSGRLGAQSGLESDRFGRGGAPGCRRRPVPLDSPRAVGGISLQGEFAVQESTMWTNTRRTTLTGKRAGFRRAACALAGYPISLHCMVRPDTQGDRAPVESVSPTEFVANSGARRCFTVNDAAAKSASGTHRAAVAGAVARVGATPTGRPPAALNRWTSLVFEGGVRPHSGPRQLRRGASVPCRRPGQSRLTGGRPLARVVPLASSGSGLIGHTTICPTPCCSGHAVPGLLVRAYLVGPACVGTAVR